MLKSCKLDSSSRFEYAACITDVSDESDEEQKLTNRTRKNYLRWSVRGGEVTVLSMIVSCMIIYITVICPVMSRRSSQSIDQVDSRARVLSKSIVLDTHIDDPLLDLDHEDVSASAGLESIRHMRLTLHSSDSELHTSHEHGPMSNSSANSRSIASGVSSSAYDPASALRQHDSSTVPPPPLPLRKVDSLPINRSAQAQTQQQPRGKSDKGRVNHEAPTAIKDVTEGSSSAKSTHQSASNQVTPVLHPTVDFLSPSLEAYFTHATSQAHQTHDSPSTDSNAMYRQLASDSVTSRTAQANKVAAAQLSPLMQLPAAAHDSSSPLIEEELQPQ